MRVRECVTPSLRGVAAEPTFVVVRPYWRKRVHRRLKSATHAGSATLPDATGPDRTAATRREAERAEAGRGARRVHRLGYT